MTVHSDLNIMSMFRWLADAWLHKDGGMKAVNVILPRYVYLSLYCASWRLYFTSVVLRALLWSGNGERAILKPQIYMSLFIKPPLCRLQQQWVMHNVIIRSKSMNCCVAMISWHVTVWMAWYMYYTMIWKWCRYVCYLNKLSVQFKETEDSDVSLPGDQ